MRIHQPAFATAFTALIAVAALVGTTGCSNDTTSPIASTTIIGDFGGTKAKLHADSTSVTIQLSCATISIPRALETDARGQFFLTGTQRSSAGAVPVNPPPGSPVTVAGLAITDGLRRIQLVIRPLAIDPPLPTGDTVVVVEGQPGNFPVCLAAGADAK